MDHVYNERRSVMLIRDLGEKSYPFVEVRTICADGKGGRDDVYTGWFSYCNGEVISEGSESYAADDEISGVVEWNDGEGIDFNGTLVNATVWKVMLGE